MYLVALVRGVCICLGCFSRPELSTFDGMIICMHEYLGVGVGLVRCEVWGESLCNPTYADRH